MKIGDLTELAARNLRESILRNSLTTLGIGVGVASLVAMLSLGIGLQQLVSRRMSNSGLFDAVFVAPKINFRGLGRPARAEQAGTGESRALDDAARQEIAHLPNVLEVYSQVRFPSEVKFAGSPFTTFVAGLPDSSRTSGAFDGMQGAFFSSPTADEAILQIELAKDLSDKPADLIGKEIILRYAERQALPEKAAANGPASVGAKNNASSAGFSIVPREKSLRIVGIVESEVGGFGGFGGGRLFIPLAVAEALRVTQASDLREAVRNTTGKRAYGNLTVRVKTPSQVQAVEDAIKKMGFAAFSLLDAARGLRIFFGVFDLLLGLFGSLALAVATLGIVNTLVMAILERRREIGVLKALGAADRDVKQLFFAEAGAMGLVGGVLGVGIGWVIGRALTFGTNVYMRRQDLPTVDVSSVPWWLVLGAIAFAILVSLAAGLYPASRAARLNPVEALRYE